MNDDFALLPWEYRGSGADLRAHVVIPALEVGGKVRRFLVKMCEGVIYFKDAESDEVFAILKRFENDLSAPEMVEVVRENVMTRNFGHYSVNPYRFLDGAKSQTKVCVIFNRKNNCGWLKEWFEPEWFSFFGYADSTTALKLHEPHLLSRELKPEWRCDIPTQWVVGSQAEFDQVMNLAGRALISAERFASRNQLNKHFLNQTRSPLGEGGLSDLYHFPPQIIPLLRRLMNKHFVAKGLTWHQWATDINNDGEDRVIEARRNTEIWGENWRGLWMTEPNFVDAAVSLSLPTTHERLEAALELREWLHGKLPEPEIDNLLRDTLK
jgi:hypothetical protein